MMLKLSERDMFDRGIGWYKISVDRMYHLIYPEETQIDQNRINAVRKSMCMLTAKEQELVFKRFIQGTSYRILQEGTNAGGLNTPVNRVAILCRILRAYILYYLESNHRQVMVQIYHKLGRQAAIVSRMLYQRKTKTYILQSKKSGLGYIKLKKTIEKIKQTCLQDRQLLPFWELLEVIHSL